MHTKTERIQRDIENLAKFSCVQGIGCTRFTYTKEFAEARDYIMEQMRNAGLEVKENEIGMVVGTLRGKNPGAPIIITGSHFDTVKTGGRFDGLAGVVAAIETARVFKDEGFVPSCDIEFVALPEEEGARFGGGLFGSRALCGKLYENELETYTDWDGISMADAMKAYGLDPSKVGCVQKNPSEVKAFVELHIEQGPILENNKIDVGIVESIVGLRCYNLTIKGRSDHAGTTPMDMRADTMVAAAKAIVAGTEKAKLLGDGTVCTFGTVSTKPGAFNIVAKETCVTIDCRGRTIENVDKVIKIIQESLDESVAANPGLSYELEEKLSAMPVVMDEDIKSIMRNKATEAGISTMSVLSGAGHDAMIMGALCKVAMVFVPSKDGRSHVPEEWTDFEDLRNGIEIVCETIREMCR